MNENVLVSVVIPVYNVENYIDRCVTSVVNQTYRNLEIILVDDGSPDKCPELCDEWAKKDSRIKVIHKNNAGLGMARNTGIDNATGKYIFFIDSDDYVDLTMIAQCVNNAEQYQSEIVMFGLYSVDKDGKMIEDNAPISSKCVYHGNEIVEYILPNMLSKDPKTGKNLRFNMSASGRMFSLKLINEHNWRFVSEREIISEDFYSLLELYKYVKIHSIINMSFYYYCENSTSLTHSYNPMRFRKVCYCYDQMEKLCIASKYSENVIECMYSQFVGAVIMTMKQTINARMSFQNKRNTFIEMTKNSFLFDVVNKMNLANETFQRKIFILLIRKRMILGLMLLVKAKC